MRHVRRIAAGSLALALLLGCDAAAHAQGALGRLRAAAGAAVVAKLPIGVEKETEIGRGIAATVAGRWRVVDDAALNGYVDLVGQVVAQQSPRGTEVAFRFAVLDTEEVNAFAAPGGYVFVTRGALAMMESEAELAGVLGHEVAHVDEKHVLDHIQRADAVRGIRDEAGLIGPVLDRIAEAGAGHLFTGLGQGDETESDSLGMLYAAAAGYRADGLLTFLARLNGAGETATVGGVRARLREWRASHPGTEGRVAALRRQLAAAALDPAAGEAVAERFRERVRRRR